MMARKPLSSSIASCGYSTPSLLPLGNNKFTLSTSTGSLFMLLGQISSGRFSGSPGRSRILSRFFTSSMRSLAAFESSRRSLRTISLRGSLRDIEDFGVRVWLEMPSADDRPERVGAGHADSEEASSAAAKISAEAMTRRSDEVYICFQKRMTKLVAILVVLGHGTGTERTFTLLRTSLSARFFSSPTHVR